MMFKVTGPMAVSLQAAFADEWVSSSGEILSGEEMYPESPANLPHAWLVSVFSQEVDEVVVDAAFEFGQRFHGA